MIRLYLYFWFLFINIIFTCVGIISWEGKYFDIFEINGWLFLLFASVISVFIHASLIMVMTEYNISVIATCIFHLLITVFICIIAIKEKDL